MQSTAQPQFSIVVPMKNEAENVALLVAEIATACEGYHFEAIFVDDGSSDQTLSRLQDASRMMPWVRVLHHTASGGQSAAIHSGVIAARAPVICTLDGDGQNPPAEIPRLAAPLLSENTSPSLGLVAGQRVRRRDTFSKRMASTTANAIRRSLLKDGTRDTGCGLKAFRRDAFLGLPFFNHMHRYLPALFAAHGWEVTHVGVEHRQRHAGSSNYNNLQRGLVGMHDLIGVAWLIRRRKRVKPQEIGTSP
ncbi:dolichol-phosphate mannosyltransferase [Peteryoungia aggregata LMG 23059]|uniref:Dolichol-phosphate mannosyltransferase n=1 Tax=Peteryoungia aggregata LMG 23059 TaxID=1368425 RepID=A0ABU0G8C9_9HYPH|nr:glycosyltransferase family 2 protein [Peteryoungia aggregata]MDQ0421595.1 dolichol-phosphate mannosyltransferase [Peteryoungia aggregata LMG 23059]